MNYWAPVTSHKILCKSESPGATQWPPRYTYGMVRYGTVHMYGIFDTIPYCPWFNGIDQLFGPLNQITSNVLFCCLFHYPFLRSVLFSVFLSFFLSSFISFYVSSFFLPFSPSFFLRPRSKKNGVNKKTNLRSSSDMRLGIKFWSSKNLGWIIIEKHRFQSNLIYFQRLMSTNR